MKKTKSSFTHTPIGFASTNPKTKRGESRDGFGISKNSRKQNLKELGRARVGA